MPARRTGQRRTSPGATPRGCGAQVPAGDARGELRGAGLLGRARRQGGAAILDGDVLLVSSVDGLLFNQDRFAVTSGRMADPSRADEVMVTQTAAAALGSARRPDHHRGDRRRRPRRISDPSRAQGRRHRPAEPGGGAGPDRSVFPPTSWGRRRSTRVAGLRHQDPRLPGRTATWRHEGRGCRRAPVELDRAVLHRFRGLVAAADTRPNRRSGPRRSPSARSASSPPSPRCSSGSR